MYKYRYPRPALTTDAIIFVDKKNVNLKNNTFVLLIQRGNEPFKNKWALPGGFMNMDETLETACKRELYEETGLAVEKMTQFKTFDSILRDPRQRTISVVYFAELATKEKVKGGDDAIRAEWFPLGKLPELAFDHQKIVNEFFTRKG